MASPFGEIAGKIAGEVAEGLTKKAAPVVAKTAKKVVKAVEDKADDWGWKGGKPGEVTGTVYAKALKAYQKTGNYDAYRDVASKAEEQLTASLRRKPNSPMARHFGTTIAEDLPAKYSATDVLHPIHALELADVPRAWTGKIANAIVQKHGRKAYAAAPDQAKTISDLMRPLTNAQRDTFVKLYPEWDGSLEDLARAAKTL